MSACRQANKAEAAQFFDVSVPTIDAWIRRGCPYIQKGGPGKGWVIDLRDAAAWYFGKADQATEEDPEKLDPKARLDWYRGTRERTKHMEESGELIPASEFERQLSTAFKSVATAIESLPDVLERDAGIDGAAVERCQAVIDRVRDELYTALSNG
jgi:phage terminase Nu1 subunit (DNA packaging protein)